MSILTLLGKLNPLKGVDIGFFIAVAAIIVIIVAVYYLIPVFNKKQYEEQRENLRKREAAFKSNQQPRPAEDKPAEVAPDAADAPKDAE